MRVAARIILASLCLLAAVASSVSAQAPGPAPAVAVAFADEAGTVTVEQESSFKATVTNAGAASGTPLDQQNAGDVTLVVTGIPDGWVVAAAPASFRLAAGASQEVTLTVSVSTGAQEGVASLTLTATLVTPLERLDPILGPVPGGTQRTSATDTLEVTRSDSVTRDILEAIGPWIYGILLLMVAAVMVAIAISVAGRRALVRLAAETRELNVPPGGRVTFPFQAEGVGKEPATVLLQVSAVPEGWTAFLPVHQISLEPSRTEELSLIVVAPKDAAQQTRQAILVTGTSAKAPRGVANLEFIAVVEGAVNEPTAAAGPKRRK